MNEARQPRLYPFAAWWAVPLRVIVGCGFIAHGLAKLSRGPSAFSNTLHALGVAHLEEIDVHPAHGRRGLGKRLVSAVCEWAATSGYSAVTLTTFRDVPWNMPFYARLGFEQIPPAELSLALLSVLEDEARRGLDRGRRVAMRRPCLPNGRADVHAERIP